MDDETKVGEPENISFIPSSLPSVAFDHWKTLPRKSGIYLAMTADESILYIGATNNLRQRWLKHHQYPQLKSLGCTTIAYYECPVEQLPKIEQAMIIQFHPPLNDPSAHDYAPGTKFTGSCTCDKWLIEAWYELVHHSEIGLSEIALAMGISPKSLGSFAKLPPYSNGHRCSRTAHIFSATKASNNPILLRAMALNLGFKTPQKRTSLNMNARETFYRTIGQMSKLSLTALSSDDIYKIFREVQRTRDFLDEFEITITHDNLKDTRNISA